MPTSSPTQPLPNEKQIEARENFCITQARQLIDRSLEKSGIGWGQLVLPEKSSVYQAFALNIGLDKYRECMKRGVTR